MVWLSQEKMEIKKPLLPRFYLNPLQLRIREIAAIGQKENPKVQYPEIAILEDKKIIMKPYLLNKNL